MYVCNVCKKELEPGTEEVCCACHAHVCRECCTITEPHGVPLCYTCDAKVKLDTPTFYIMCDDDTYCDVSMYFSVNDELRTGGVVTITIHKKKKRAYLSVTGNDDNGTDFFSEEINPVPLDWAVAIVKQAFKEKAR